jgi:simple sugar transport system substrate-binding protein
MDAMKAAGVTYGVDGDVILISFDACTAGLEYVITGDINADFECNPLAAPFVEEVIQQIEAGETPDKEVYMEEHWYVNEDILSTITVDGAEQALTVVTDEIIEAQY